MGNVLDCSSDPLDQIHEGPDAGAPTEVNEGGDASSVAGQAGTERGKGGVGWEEGQTGKPQKPEVLYLEKAVPLRDSIMWELQRMYYTAHHVQCWEKMVVPCFVTSNSFIARAYARVLVGFMRDWFLFSDQANRSEPILILEIGSGHGKFACLVLQHILDMREFLPTLRGCSNTPNSGELPSGGDGTEESNGAVGAGNGTAGGDHRYEGLPFRYIVTDVAQGTLDYVRSHASMQKFLEAGVLDLAILDAEDAAPSSELRLQVSDVVVDLKARENPVAAVCNYVFDSLRQDAFRVKEKTLYENRVSITAARPLPDDLSQLSLNALQGLGLQWDHNPYVVSPERARAFYAGLETGDQKEANGNSLEGITGPGEGDGGARDAPASGGCSTGEGGVDQGGATSSVAGGEPNAPESIGEGASMGATGTTEEAGAGAGSGDSNCGGERSEGNSGRGGVASSGDSDFDDLLASYLEGSFGEAGGSLLVPLGGLRLLRCLASLARGRCLVLAGDKGYVDEEEMSGQRDPHIAYHGSLSCMVNLDALARYTRQRGGWALSSPYMEGFKCQALAFGMGEEILEESRLAFEAATQEFGPESFSTLQRAIKDEVAAPSLSLATQLLRLSQLDPDVFMKFRVSLVQQVSNHDLSPPIWEDLKNDVLAIAEKWFPLQQGKDVNFEVARLLMALKDFESALELFGRSDRICGEHNVTCHNMGMSYFYLGRLPEAKECFERSLALDGTYEDSMQWLAHVNRNMEPSSSAEEVLSADNAAGRRTGSEPMAETDEPEAGTVDVNEQ